MRRRSGVQAMQAELAMNEARRRRHTHGQRPPRRLPGSGAGLEPGRAARTASGRGPRTAWPWVRPARALAAALGAGLLLLGGGGGVAHSQGGAPVIQVLESGQPLADGSWFNRAVTPVVQISGGQAPVTVTALLDGSPFASGSAVAAQGGHRLAVTAQDAAGAAATPVAVGFTIKTSPPVFGQLRPASNSILAATQVTVTGSVDSAVSVTVAGQAATLAGGQGGQSFSAGPIALAEGGNSLGLSATDAAGNVGTATLTLVRDTTPPVVAISQPATGTVVGTPAVDVVGSASDLHLASVTVNGTVAAVTGGLFRAAQVPLAEGSNSVAAVAVDQAGNQSQATAVVVRDTQPPALQITSPAGGTVVPGATITVSGVASDPHLDRVMVAGAPAALAAVPASGGASVTWSAPVQLQTGNNVIAVQAIDVVGNTTSAQVAVVRDSSVPQVHIDVPADGASLRTTTADVSGTVQQKAGMAVTVNGAAATVNGTAFTLAGVALAEGQNRLVARATDPAGNQGVHSILVNRDTVPPRFVAADPASGAQGLGAGTVFRLTFSEPMATPAPGSWALQAVSGPGGATITPLAAGATLSGGTLTVQPAAALPPAAAVQLVLTAGLTDLAGNPLANPQTLSYTTLDTSAPPAPVVASVPAYLCAQAVTLTGTAAPGSVIDVAGGAAAAETRADAANGQFSVAVLLAPASLNRLLVTATAPATGVASAPAVVQVVQDCQAPYVVSAQVAGGTVVVAFSKPVDPSSVAVAGGVTLTAGSGPVAGTVALSADGRTATFTPSPAGTPLPAGVLRLDVSTAVRDVAGNALAYPYTQLFGAGTAAGASFLAGTAIDNAVGRPLAGAQALVALSNGAAPPSPAPEQVTGADGAFRLAVPAGTHQLWIGRQGYTPAYRVVTVAGGQGASVFAPRLTPAAGAQAVGPAGGTVVGTPPGAPGAGGGTGGAGGAGGGGGTAPSLVVPGGALAAPAAVSLTGLDEQGLPAVLPFGWSPRGAAWLDTGGATLQATATLSLPVEAPEGAPLALVRLDPATLQWRVIAAGVPVTGGAIAAPLSGGGFDGGYAAVDPDTSAEAPSVPPAAVAGAVLPAAQPPAGTEVSAATLGFNPATVLPAQTSLATALYTVAAGGVASGMPLTLSVAEQLTLLDGTTRKAPPYPADLVLYHAADGTPRSRFRLAPSQQAQALPLAMGSEVVGLRLYAGGTAQGNVLGPAGGTFTSGDGDRIDLPPGALGQATPVALARVAAADLPLPAPAGTELAGALRLDLAGQPLLAPATLTLALPAAPAAGASGLLLEVADFGSGPVLRPVAALAAAGSAWTTAPIVAGDLPWPGVREGGIYLFVRLTAPTGYLHGTVTGPAAGGAGAGGPVASVLVTAAGLGWTQATSATGAYVLPAPAGTAAVAAFDPATGNAAAAAAAVPGDGARVQLDLALRAVPLAVVATTPADGSTGVLPGIQPSLTFNRPLDANSATGAAGGVQLLLGTQLVAADVTVQGATVHLAPRASLQQGTAYRLQATTAVRDRYGNTLPAAVTVSFTTQTLTLPASFDLTRVFLVEPPAGGGLAQVIGQPGALPAGALVFVENTTALASTPSTTVGQDGSFSLSIQAALTDRLVLHVLVSGQNEVQAPLGPFHSADLASAVVGAAGASFYTGAGVAVAVPAGAFAAPTRVRVTPHAVTDPPAAPAPEDLAPVYAFGLDFSAYADGSPVAGAAKALQIAVPLPPATPAPPGGVYWLTREIEPFGEKLWMLMDLMVLDAAGHRLTTVVPAAGGGAAASAAAASGTKAAPAAPAAGSSAASGAARAAAALSAPPAPGTAQPLDASQAQRGKQYLPGSAFPGQYQVYEPLPDATFGYYALPVGFVDGVVYNTAERGMAASVNEAVARLLAYDSVLIPTHLNRPATITVRDLATGYVLFKHTFDAPPSADPIAIPPEAFGDSKPPLPVSGSPVRFFLLDPSAQPKADLDVGIKLAATDGSMTISGDPGAAQANVAIRVIGVDDDTSQQQQADGSGGFNLTVSTKPQKRYLLALGAVVAGDQPLVVTFTKGIDPSWAGLDVLDQSTSVAPRFDPLGSHATVRISPAAGWAAGKTYTLHLGKEVNDGNGDAWKKTLDVPFQVQKSQVLNTYKVAAARDVARMGSLLFVAADTTGLVVLDGSDPNNLINVVPGDIAFPFPYNDPVRGVTVDPHGRVIVVGGGVTGFGQLKIFDPVKLDPAAVAASPNDPKVRYAAFRGSTLLSDGISGNATTNLPEGTPRRVVALTNDDAADWAAGGTPPPGVTVQPPNPPDPPPSSGEYSITVTGGGLTKNRPVTLFDRTIGRFKRSDVADDGTFSITLTVRPGDRLELLRNRNSLAYVATLGVGVEAVDLDKVYNKPDDPTKPAVLSEVLGIYSGFQDPKLLLCSAPVVDLAGVLTDIGLLYDPANAHPLVTAGLVGNNGVVLLEDDPASPGHLKFLTDVCADFKGNRSVTGMAVVQRYAFDFNGDGRLDPSEQRDYLVVTHRLAGVLIYDVTDRANPQLVGQIPLPGEAAHVGVDRQHRRLLVAGYGGGVYVVDFNRPPSVGLLDQNGDGTDDRVLDTIKLDGNTDAPVFLEPDLGLAFAGGLKRGVTSIAVGGPLLVATAYNLQPAADGSPGIGSRQVSRIAPFGVPSAVEGDNHQNQPGLIRVQATLPATLGQNQQTVMLDVLSVGPTGAEITPPGDPDQLTDLPRVELKGTDHGIKLTRLSDNLWEEGHQLYLSEPIVVLGDLKASHKYTRSKDEDDRCTRCDLKAEKAPDDARELLSGDTVEVRLPQPLRDRLNKVYQPEQLDGAELAVPSVRWELTPAPRQEPAQNAVPQQGVLLHSGEMTSSAVDMTIAGRGMDFVFERHYRSQAVGDGPFGPGWEHNFYQRLRQLPTGDVEYYDGRGRREVFQAMQAGLFTSPTGVFSTLQKTSDGFILLDPRHNLTSFDRAGRLLSLADAVKQDDSTGNEITVHYDGKSRINRITETLGRDITFTYDEHGHITKMSDFDGRDVTYEYDQAGRLTKATGPTVVTGTSGQSTQAGGIETTYTYDSAGGGLAATLGARGKMTSATDGKQQTWLRVSYADLHGSGRREEVQSQTWSSGTVQFDYQFDQRQAKVTDPRGNQLTFTTTQGGQISQVTDPAQATAYFTHDAEGLLTSRTEPLGRVTSYGYDNSGDRRSRGNVTTVQVVPDDPRATNGSGPTLVTTTLYESYSNLPVQIVDPRGSKTIISRDRGLPTDVVKAFGAAEATHTHTDYNAYGQPSQTIDANGRVTQYFYSQIGYLQQEIVDPAGLSLSTSYGTDARGNVTTMIDPRGVVHKRTYDAMNWITSSTRAASGSLDGAPALGYTTTYLHDANGNLTEETVPFGDGSSATRVRHSYGPLDELLAVAREVTPGGAWSTTAYGYDANLNRYLTVEPDGQRTRLIYDFRNLPVVRYRGDGSPDQVVEAFDYDLDRRVTKYTDGRGNPWLTRYDGYGRVASTVDPLGNASFTSYDDAGNPVGASIVQAGDKPLLLAQRSASYDLLGRRTALSSKLWQYGDASNNGGPAMRDLTTTLRYDPASNLVAVVDPLQRTTTFEYDAAERKTAAVDAAGNRVEYKLDRDGNALETRSIEQATGGTAGPPGAGATFHAYATFDALGRQLTAKDDLGNTRSFGYDARNNLIFSVDAEQNLTTQGWDALDRLVQSVRPEGIEVDYGYDASSRLRTYTDALHNQTSYDYDALNRRTRVTYPDHTAEVTTYDFNGNPTQVVDANGTVIAQLFDVANRMTSRSATGGGISGATSETYVYDGLHRLTHAQSGNQATDLAFDSLSRRVREVVGGRPVTYGFDDAGNETAIGYPSGYAVGRSFDPLDRLLTVAPTNGSAQGAPLASFGFLGPDLVARKSLGNGLAGVRQFDAAKRLVDDWFQLSVPGGGPAPTVFREGLAWTPRGLKAAQGRGDLGGAGLLFAYDKAERLVAAGRSPSPLATAPNNSVPGLRDVTALPNAFGYTYDVAQNLLGKTESSNGIAATTALPLDGSGRNRPGAVGAVALQWDKNGNLVQKGNLNFHYDFRNRLVQVTDGGNGGAEIAHYEYDVFNRRISKTAGNSSRLTVWQGWRSIEDYDPAGAGRLVQRRTYGSGPDEILYLESDLDGSGNVASKSWPLYDATGNLALLTGASGKPLERYEYGPYGAQTILVNSTPPAVQQVRVVGGAIWVELSEAVQPGPLSGDPTFGPATPITLFDNTANQPFGSLAVTQPVQAGDDAGRRLIITAGQAPAGLQAGDQVTLTIPAGALVDSFLNQPAQPYTLTFAWPKSDAVVADTAAPKVQRVTLRAGTLEVELSAEPNQAAAAAAIQLDGGALTWTLAADRYTLVSATQVPAGQHTLAIATTLTDIGGQALAAAFSQSFTAAAQDTQALFAAPNPHQTSASAVGNQFGYQGLPRDSETGLIYFRNRYYDPELGRFITADPKGYVDGPSEYAFEGDDPVNGSDPMGLCFGFGGGTCADVADRAAVKLHKFKSKISADDPGILGIVANTIAGTTVDAVESFLVDPLRAGQATGAAIGSGASGGQIALAVIQDTGRAAAVAAGAGTAVKAVSRGIGAVSKGVKAAGRVAKRSGEAAEAAEAVTKAKPPEGIVYKRTNSQTGETYIGQSRSPARFKARQAEHDRAQGVRHDYDVLGRAEPGTSLDVLEESKIREHGGIQREGGPLANKRHQMSEKRYRESGGTVPNPQN
jgi:RHS repeat-associated protein